MQLIGILQSVADDQLAPRGMCHSLQTLCHLPVLVCSGVSVDCGLVCVCGCAGDTMAAFATVLRRVSADVQERLIYRTQASRARHSPLHQRSLPDLHSRRNPRLQAHAAAVGLPRTAVPVALCSGSLTDQGDGSPCQPRNRYLRSPSATTSRCGCLRWSAPSLACLSSTASSTSVS